MTSVNEHHLLVIDTLDHNQINAATEAAFAGKKIKAGVTVWDAKASPSCSIGGDDQQSIMRPEDYKAAPTVLRNAFPSRGTRKLISTRQSPARVAGPGSKVASPKPKTAAPIEDVKECSLYQGSFSFPEPQGSGREFGIISGPLSIEVVNNESVFSEAMD